MASAHTHAVRFIVVALFIAVSAAASLVLQGAQVRERDASWTAPAEEASRLNPLATRPDAVAGGAKIFQQRCSTCHGEDGRGTTKAPDLSQPGVQGQSDGALFWKISGGNSRQGMPSFSFLPEPQRWQVVLRVRAIASSSGGNVPAIDRASLRNQSSCLQAFRATSSADHIPKTVDLTCGAQCQFGPAGSVCTVTSAPGSSA
jgi:mono/diheme cytochrome c family protein